MYAGPQAKDMVVHYMSCYNRKNQISKTQNSADCMQGCGWRSWPGTSVIAMLNPEMLNLQPNTLQVYTGPEAKDMAGHLMVYPYSVSENGTVSYLGSEMLPDTKTAKVRTFCMRAGSWVSAEVPGVGLEACTRTALAQRPLQRSEQRQRRMACLPHS